MEVLWPEKVKSHFRVYHPINSGGTTWLRESDLVFVHKRPYAVLSWSHTDRGDVPEKFCELFGQQASNSPLLGGSPTLGRPSCKYCGPRR